MKKLVLIDSNAIIHRAYHSIPKTFTNKRGEKTNAVYGFTTTVIKVLEDLKPDYVAASFDIAKKTFRHKEYKEYKATRVAADQELYDQIPRVRELLEKMGIPVYDREGYEADDCIGTIAEKLIKKRQENKIKIFIVTGDKDLFQLIDGNVFVYQLRKGLSDTAIVDREKIKEEYNLEPEDFIDLKALAGDPSDNIPGVPNIGPKTATFLLQKFDTLEKLYQLIDEKQIKEEQISETAEEIGIKPRILRLLIDNKDQAFMSQKLATIYTKVPIDFVLEKSKQGEYDKNELKLFFEEMGFKSLIKRFTENGEEPKTKQAKEQKEKDQQLKLL